MTRRHSSPIPDKALHAEPVILVSWILMLAAGAAGADSGPVLEARPDVSDTGYFRLTWKGPKKAGYELQESRAEDFSQAVVIYKGSDRATVRSGLDNGTYYYRVRRGDGPWSRTLAVTVKHHELSKSFVFMGLGFTVFVITALLILIGHARQRKENGHG